MDSTNNPRMTDPMTRDQRDRLRALAEQARDTYAQSYADRAFIAACSPSVVLSLLDALDASRRDAVREFAVHLTDYGTVLQREKLPSVAEAYLAATSHTPEPAHD